MTNLIWLWNLMWVKPNPGTCSDCGKKVGDNATMCNECEWWHAIK